MTQRSQTHRGPPVKMTARNKVKVNTEGVFVDINACPLPEGYIRPSARQLEEKALLRRAGK